MWSFLLKISLFPSEFPPKMMVNYRSPVNPSPVELLATWWNLTLVTLSKYLGFLWYFNNDSKDGIPSSTLLFSYQFIPFDRVHFDKTSFDYAQMNDVWTYFLKVQWTVVCELFDKKLNVLFNFCINMKISHYSPVFWLPHTQFIMK